jgi:hypothetical protein
MFFYNANIRRITGFSIPILFGEEQPTKRELFSYSIYNDFSVKQLRFKNKEIYQYDYNRETGFIESLKVYSSKNILTGELLFELIQNKTDLIEFKHTFRGGKSPVTGELTKISNLGEYKLFFSRVGEVTFLGYKNCKFIINDNFDVLEEMYYNPKTLQIDLLIRSEFEFFNSQIESKATNILTNGW